MDRTVREVMVIGLGVIVLLGLVGAAAAQDCTPVLQMPQCSSPKTIDGSLTDWVDPCWIDLDLLYAGEPCDIVSAKYVACWDPSEDKIYAAIVVDDTSHVFETAPIWHDSSDRVEIYVQGDPNGGVDWGYEASATFDVAQHYAVGYQNIIPGWSWAVFGNGSYIPGEYEPGNAEFQDSARVSGSVITYEIGAKAWQYYGGKSGRPNVKRELQAGIEVGFDVLALGRRGPNPDEWGTVSENPWTCKHVDAAKFRRHLLVDTWAPRPRVQVLWPNGGELLISGQTYGITWDATAQPPINQIQIEYSDDEGGTWNPIESGTDNDGAYDWLAPEASSVLCLIRISDADDPCNCDTSGASDNVFTIIPEYGWSYPACWDHTYQCYGDYDEDTDVDTVDWPTFRDGFGYSYPHPLYTTNVCADHDKDGDIDTVDWPSFRDNFGHMLTGCTGPRCLPGDINHVFQP